MRFPAAVIVSAKTLMNGSIPQLAQRGREIRRTMTRSCPIAWDVRPRENARFNGRLLETNCFGSI